MVKFSFYDKNHERIRHFNASDCLPDEVERIEITGPFDSYKSDYEVFTTMLKNSPRKLEEINCHYLSAESPEFLAFMVLVCNKAKSMFLDHCRLSSNAMSCLMAALLTADGIRSLAIVSITMEMFTDEAKILFQGVASSPCLESLSINIRDYADSQEVSRCLIQALNRNRSLKEISLEVSPFRAEPSFVPRLLKALTVGSNVKSVTIENSGTDLSGGLQVDMLRDLLCREDCALEKLDLDGFRILTDQDGDNKSIVQNTSVKSLALMHCSLSNGGELTKILGLFKSLVNLDLADNSINQLSFLDPLLFGKRSQLESLDVNLNPINEEEVKIFIEKLRKVRGLKYLSIGGHRGEMSTPLATALNDALRNNTDLEFGEYTGGGQFLHDLNRGGRRLFEPEPEPFPKNLLPQVLKRASKISYYGKYDVWGNPSETTARADVIYWMIQRAVPHL